MTLYVRQYSVIEYNWEKLLQKRETACIEYCSKVISHKNEPLLLQNLDISGNGNEITAFLVQNVALTIAM